MQHSRLAAFWTVAGVLGTLAVFPYALAINPALVAQLPLRAAGAVLVLAPGVARCTSCISMPASRFRQPAIDLGIALQHWIFDPKGKRWNRLTGYKQNTT